MSRRRQARARSLESVVSSAGGVPGVLLLGRCIEVWADAPGVAGAQYTAFTRFGLVRRWWLDAAEVTEAAEQSALVPGGSPWSLEYMTARDAEGGSG